jgi:hypothetical protein
MAQVAAAVSTQAITSPPKSVPCAFVCCGRTMCSWCVALALGGRPADCGSEFIAAADLL